MSRSPASQSPSIPPLAFRALLLVNGIAIGLTGCVQAVFDLAAYFLNRGPLAGALHGKLDTLAFFEAHGLALVIAILLVVHRAAPDARWHWVAAATHTLLGSANLMFWPIFAANDLVPMGIVATTAHVVFAVAQFAAAAMRRHQLDPR